MAVLDFEDTQGNDACIDININNKRDAFSYYNGGTNKYRLTKDGYMYTTSGWKDRYLPLNIGDVAADSDAYTIPLLVANVDITITNVELACDTTAAANATNYQTISLYNSASSTTMAGTLTNASTAFTQATPRAFGSISSTLGKIAAGRSLNMTIVKSGSGTALSGVTVAIDFTIDIPEAEKGTATDNIIRVVNGGAGSDGMVESDHLQRDHLRLCRNDEEVLTIDAAGIIRGGCDYTPPDLYHFVAINAGTIVTADSGAKIIPLLNRTAGTCYIKKVYMAVDVAHAADSDANFMQVLIKNDNGDVLTDAYIDGPQSESGMSAGIFVDMGTINETYNEILAAEFLQAEFLQTGTATTIERLTFVVCYTFI